jgi:hypothetical protein
MLVKLEWEPLKIGSNPLTLRNWALFIDNIFYTLQNKRWVVRHGTD